MLADGRLRDFDQLRTLVTSDLFQSWADKLAETRAQIERLRSLELRENSRIVMGGAVEGGLQSLTGKDANLEYAEDGETLERVVLAGGGVIQLAGANGQPGRQIAGEIINVQLAPDGAVTRLTARGKVELTLPATAEAPTRVIRAASMNGVGEEGRGLTGARFNDDVEFREQKAGAPARVARSRTLRVVLAGGSRLEDADLLSRMEVAVQAGAMTAAFGFASMVKSAQSSITRSRMSSCIWPWPMRISASGTMSRRWRATSSMLWTRLCTK